MAELNDDGRVRAAGGVVWRRRDEGGIEVLAVHRPRHRDWSLPKGKARAGESDEECALREVEEETGLQCRLGEELPGTSYRDAQGRPKAVRYWAMVATGGQFVPHGEVDDVRWLLSQEAAAMLTYERDRAVVASLGEEGPARGEDVTAPAGLGPRLGEEGGVGAPPGDKT